MRILQIVPSLEMGGVERNTIQSAIIIKKNKMIPLVISSGGKMVSELDKESIQHIKLWVNSKNPIIMIINAFIIAMIIFLKKINIVHVRSRAPAWSTWLACKLTGAIMITTFHGSYSGYNNCIKRKYNSIMTCGKKTIVSNQYMKAHLQKYYQKNYNIKIIPRGVCLNRFQNISKDRILFMKQKYNITNQLVVSLPGRLTDWKGQKVFLESIKYIDSKDIKYLIIGDGNNNYYQELKDYIIKYNLPVTIDKNCEDIAAMYQISDIIISASTKSETFGRIAVEGMASGKIVIATNICGSTHTIVNYKSGFLIQPNNPKVLAEYIINIKNKNLTLNVKDILDQADKFSLKNYEKNIVSFYKSL